MNPQSVTVVASLSFAAGCFLVVDQAAFLQHGEITGLIRQCLQSAAIALISLSCLSWLILRLGGRGKSALVVACLPTVGMLYTIMHLPAASKEDLARHITEGYIACICIVDSRANSNSNSFICRPQTLLYPSKEKLRGLTLLNVTGSRSTPLAPGQRIRVFGQVSRIALAPDRWQFDANRRLANKGIVTTIRSSSSEIRVLGLDDHLAPTMLEKARHDIIDSHERALGKEKGDLLSAMVLGDRVVHLSCEIKDKFRDVGLSHLLAASGLNLSIVVAASYLISRLARLPTIVRIAIAAISTVSFVCLAGPSPSVLRAALLCGLFLIARLFARRLHSVAALSITLWLALLVQPLSISDIGLQLSYAATGSIIIGMQRASRRQANTLFKKVNIWFRDTVRVIILAQLAVLPLQLFHFRSAGLLFLPANLMVDPVVAPITLLAFASSIATLIFGLMPSTSCISGWLTQAIDGLTSLPLDYMILSATALASIKGAMLHLPPPVAGAIPIYYTCLLFYFYLSSRSPFRMLGLVLLIGGIAILFFRPQTPGQLTFISKTSLIAIQQHHRVLTANDKGFDWLSRQFLSFVGEPVTYHSQMQSLKRLVLQASDNKRTDSHHSKKKRRKFRRKVTRYATTTGSNLRSVPAAVEPAEVVEPAAVEPAESITIEAVDAGDFVIVGKRNSGCLTALTKSQVLQLEALIADDEIKLSESASRCSPRLAWSRALQAMKKPIVIWSTGRKSGIMQSPWIAEAYIAYAGSRSALILSRSTPGMVAQQQADVSQPAEVSHARGDNTPRPPTGGRNVLTIAIQTAGAIVRSAIGMSRRSTLYYPFQVKTRIGKINVLN